MKQAQESLESGFNRLQKYSAPTERELPAVLSLAQLYVDQSQANKAVTVLEDAKLGPLALSKKNSAATHGEGIATEIQQIALLAYLGAQPQQLNKATAALDALEQSSADAAAKTGVTQMLVRIAYDLQQKVDELRQQNDQEKLAPAAAALKTLLGRIADQSATADSNTLIWLAEAFEKLAGAAAGAEKSPVDGKLPPEVEANNRQAIKLYEQILARAKSEADFLPAEKAIAVRYRLAIVYRGLGDFDSSTARLAEILKAKPTLLSVQIEAARTYQMRVPSIRQSITSRQFKGAKARRRRFGAGESSPIKLRKTPSSAIRFMRPGTTSPCADSCTPYRGPIPTARKRNCWHWPKTASAKRSNLNRQWGAKSGNLNTTPCCASCKQRSINRRSACTSSKTKRPKRPVPITNENNHGEERRFL